MTPWLIAQSALQALRMNSLRTALTMLGIIVGVGAVVAMVAVGTGAQVQVAERIQSLGANVIMLRSGAATQGGARLGRGSRLTISEDDARAIEREVPGVVAAAPMVRGQLQAEYGNLNDATTLYGVTASYFDARDWTASVGKLFSDDDVTTGAKVAVLGQTVAETLFGGVNPLGEVIRVNKVPLTVIGVLESKGQTHSGQDQDDVIVVPMTTAKARLLGYSRSGRASVHAIAVKVARAEAMSEAESQIRVLLRHRHRLQAKEEDDFVVRNLADVLDAQDASARVLTLLLAAIASVSLLVGGIGIMNIMLVSVIERTREIGVRRALGARARDILSQFLLEGLAVAVAGGAAGATLGIMVTFLLALGAGWPVVIQPSVVTLAVGFAGLVGVFFGYYPARKAARLDPIDALRHQ
jgi:putative ABC transport system permease protein